MLLKLKAKLLLLHLKPETKKQKFPNSLLR